VELFEKDASRIVAIALRAGSVHGGHSVRWPFLTYVMSNKLPSLFSMKVSFEIKRVSRS
jgi:hypothetical protein